MKKEISNFLSVPDFEKRCDDFVLRVTDEIVDEFPELGIHPINETRNEILSFSQKLIAFSEKKHGKIAHFWRRYYQKMDEESAYQSEALIDIYGWEGVSAIPDIKTASSMIDKIAKECGGIKEVFGNEEETINDLNFPSIRLVYTFR